MGISHAANQLIARIVEEARRIAKRWGHAEVTYEHLALTVAKEFPGQLERLDAEAQEAFSAQKLEQLMWKIDRAFTEPEVGSSIRELVAEVSEAKDPIFEFLNSISARVLERRASLAAPTPDQAVRTLTGTETVLERDAVVEEILVSLAMRDPLIPLILGGEGSGRTSIAHALAQQVGKLEAGSRFAGYTVKYLDLATLGPREAQQSILAAFPAETSTAGTHEASETESLESPTQTVPDRLILFIDNLEVGAALGGAQQPDMALLNTLHRLIQENRHPLVLALETPYLALLEHLHPELVSGMQYVHLPELSDTTLSRIAQHHAESLAQFHGSELEPELLKNVVARRTEQERLSHPGLTLMRMDRAAARFALLNSTTFDAGLAQPVSSKPTFDAATTRAGVRAAIKGQDDAVDTVVKRLRITRADLDARPHRPDGVFLLAGPTGVGKTAFAMALAEELLDSEDGLIRLDMSEYSEPHSVSKLVGSPPGYVGSDKPEQWLTTKMLENPHRVVLLDEIEKAHPSVWQTFLQVFDAGRLTDSTGATADFRESVILLTSNIGAATFSDDARIGFGDNASSQSESADERQVVRAIRERMAPELINRFDDILVFRPLERDAVEAIARKEIDALRARISARGFALTVTEQALAQLTERGYSREYGARPMLRLIETEVLSPLSEMGRESTSFLWMMRVPSWCAPWQLVSRKASICFVGHVGRQPFSGLIEVPRGKAGRRYFSRSSLRHYQSLLVRPAS